MEAMFLRNVGLSPNYMTLKPREDRIFHSHCCENIKSKWYPAVLYGCKTWSLTLRLEVFGQQGSEQNIRTYEREMKSRLEKTA
jgi:hypothetical protein